MIRLIIQFFTLIFQLVGLGLFAFSIWIRVEPGFEEWIQILDIYSYYIGVYILIGVSVIVLLTSFLGCCSALMEHGVALLIVSRLITQYTYNDIIHYFLHSFVLINLLKI